MKSELDISRGGEAPAFDINQFDFSTLVGYKVTIYAEQFPGKPLPSRVIVANGHSLSIDRSGAAGLIDTLVNNQQVTVQVSYKGEPVSVHAAVKRSEGGTCRLDLGDTVVPLYRRRYRRLPLNRKVRMAIIPKAAFSNRGLANLRWIETDTINISGGGMLLSYSTALSHPTCLLANIADPDVEFPSLMVGQVRYSLAVDTGRWHVGIEFIPREAHDNHFSLTTVDQLPKAILAYDETMRDNLDRKFRAWTQ